MKDNKRLARPQQDYSWQSVLLYSWVSLNFLVLSCCWRRGLCFEEVRGGSSENKKIPNGSLDQS